MNDLSSSHPKTSVTTSRQMASNEKKSAVVLCLDGGGVRGLSSLIILEDLLRRVNGKVNPSTHNGEPLDPSEVFDLIVGTSTGGLIALMLVKFNMSVGECIKKYKKLSKKIFKQWHFFGKFSGGFGSIKKFSSKNLRKVLLKHVVEPSLENSKREAEAYQMEDIESHPELMCSVVCREIYSTTRQRTPRTVFLCTHWDASDPNSAVVCNACCRKQYAVANQADRIRVIDAARATSAAPTYFKHVALLGTLLVDGGFGDTNNPSLATYLHYFFDPSLWQSIQMVNIGTGTEPDRPSDWQPKKSFPVDYMPWLQGLTRTTKDLATLATESERVGALMRQNAKYSPGGVLKFDRFSANRDDIHQIRLYKYQSIQEIERITKDYLQDEEVCARLDRVAEELAETYRARRVQTQSASSPPHQAALPILQHQSASPPGQGPQPVLFEAILPQTVVNDHHDDRIQLDGLLVPGNEPGLTDTSSIGSSDAPPTPQKEASKQRTLFRTRKVLG